jgi:hypothetical protein
MCCERSADENSQHKIAISTHITAQSAHRNFSIITDSLGGFWRVVCGFNSNNSTKTEHNTHSTLCGVCGVCVDAWGWMWEWIWGGCSVI